MEKVIRLNLNQKFAPTEFVVTDEWSWKTFLGDYINSDRSVQNIVPTKRRFFLERVTELEGGESFTSYQTVWGDAWEDVVRYDDVIASYLHILQLQFGSDAIWNVGSSNFIALIGGFQCAAHELSLKRLAYNDWSPSFECHPEFYSVFFRRTNALPVFASNEASH
jgi:hypothetical protein